MACQRVFSHRLPANLRTASIGFRFMSAMTPCWAVIAVVLVVAETALAQEYRQLPIVDGIRLGNVAVARRVIHNPETYLTEKQRFQDYFTKYYFPAMTRYSPDDLAELGKLRFDLFNQYLWQATSETIQKDLTDLVYKYMWQIAKDRHFHPAVRYNAILVLGQLDEQYATNGGARPRPPTPLPKANALLTSVAGAAKVPPLLLVGALVGLERHAKYKDNLPPSNIDNMSKVMLKLIAEKEPPGDASSNVHYWIKRLAAGVLAELGTAGPNNEIHAAFLQLLGDQQMPLDDRCQVAGMLGKLNYAGPAPDGQAAAKQIVTLLNDVCKHEVKKAKEFEDMKIGTGPRSRGIVDPSAITYQRGRLLGHLHNMRPGLEVVTQMSPDQTKAQLDTVKKTVDNTIKFVDDDTKVDLDVVDSIRELAGVVSGLADSWDAPDVEATTAATDADDSVL